MNKSRLVQLAGPYGLYGLARHWTRDHPRVLMYHRFSREPRQGFTSSGAFESQVRHIANHYHPTTLGTLVQHLRTLTRPPPNSIVITVDDGYDDFHDIAFPILRKYGVPATFFVTTGFVDQELWLWPDQVGWLLSTGEPSVDVIELHQHRIPRDQNAWERVINLLLCQADTDKHLAIQSMAQQLGVRLPSHAPGGFRSCTWEQLRDMQAAGIEIGGHTHTHPSLTRVSEDALRLELTHCLARLTEELGPAPRPFCYPNGGVDDYSTDVRAAVESAGFTGAVLAYADHLAHDDVYALKRHSSGDCMFQFMKASSGLEWLGRRLEARRSAT